MKRPEIRRELDARNAQAPDTRPMYLVTGEAIDRSPTTLEQAKGEQLVRAMERMEADYSNCPTFGFLDLAKATGPLLPGQLWIVLARPENGKTTFCLNVARSWLSSGHGFVYFGTEEASDSLQLRFAAIRTGNDPGAVVAGQWIDDQQKREIQHELLRLNSGNLRHKVFFAEETRPSLVDLTRAAEEACRLDVPILVLDHFHRMALPDSPNQTATKAETVRRIKQLAVDTGLVIVMAAQARRGEGPLARFLPPTPEGGMDTSAIEQEADAMLGLFRPLKRNEDGKPLTRAQLQAFEQGEAETSAILMPHTMGVKVLKHRRNADLSGRIAHLHCERGMLSNRSYL